MRRFNIFFFFFFVFLFLFVEKQTGIFLCALFFLLPKVWCVIIKLLYNWSTLRRKVYCHCLRKLSWQTTTTKSSTEKLSQGILMQENCYAPENLLMQMFLSFFFFFYVSFIVLLVERNNNTKNEKKTITQMSYKKLLTKEFMFLFFEFSSKLFPNSNNNNNTGRKNYDKQLKYLWIIFDVKFLESFEYFIFLKLMIDGSNDWPFVK